MKKIQILGTALFALFAFSAVLAATASAEVTLLAEWLNGTAAITTLTSTEGNGTLLLEDTSNKGAVECTGTLDGSVGANGEDETTEVLQAGVAKTLAAPLTNCTAATGSACAKEADIEVGPEELPWHTLLYLTEAGALRDEVQSAGYSVKCLVIGILITDECKGKSSFEIKNVAGGVELLGEATPKSNCSIGGNNTGKIEPLTGNLLKLLTGTLVGASE